MTIKIEERRDLYKQLMQLKSEFQFNWKIKTEELYGTYLESDSKLEFFKECLAKYNNTFANIKPVNRDLQERKELATFQTLANRYVSHLAQKTEAKITTDEINITIDKSYKPISYLSK